MYKRKLFLLPLKETQTLKSLTKGRDKAIPHSECVFSVNQWAEKSSSLFWPSFSILWMWLVPQEFMYNSRNLIMVRKTD